MELLRRCEINPNTSVENGDSSPHPKVYSLKTGIVKIISFSFTCNVEGADWQPWKLSPLFLHRTGIARAAAMQASPHCPANVPQPSSEEVTSGGEWVEESLSMQLLLPGSGSCRTGCWTETDPLSWMNHQSLTDNHFTYCKATWAGFIDCIILLDCCHILVFLCGWMAPLHFFFFFLHCFVFRAFVNALCTRLQSSMQITECSLIVNVIQKSSYWWQPCVQEEL